MRRLASAILTVAVALPAVPSGAALAAPAGLPSLLDARTEAFSGEAGIVVQDGNTGKVLYEHDGDESVIAASLYKLGVLVEAERRVEAGTLHYSDPIAIEPEDVTEDGSYEFPGTTLTLDDALEQMITISDNGAALALVRILGARQINASLAALRIAPFHLAEDASEDNEASPRAIATLFTLMAEGKLVSKAASGRMLVRLEHQKINDRLPAQLPPGTLVAHKTGNLGWATHDAGVIFGKDGAPLVVVAMTWNSGEEEATDFIQTIGALVYANAVASPTNVSYSVPQQPVPAVTGKTIVQTIRVTNLGPNDWRLADRDPFRLVWDMSDARGAVVERSRAPLPLWDVPVGRSIDYPIVLDVPLVAGDYKVTFGLANGTDGVLASIGAPTATLTVHATPPLLVKLDVGLSSLLHRGEASAAIVNLTSTDDLASATSLALAWRLLDRSSNAVTQGSLPIGIAQPNGALSHLVPFVAPSIRGPFTLELWAVTEGRVASGLVRKSVEIDAPRTYPGEPESGLPTRAPARP